VIGGADGLAVGLKQLTEMHENDPMFDAAPADIAAMREPNSAWVATAATNPAVVGEVSVRALAMLLAGEDPGHNVVIPPTLITRKALLDGDIKSMEDLSAKMPQFAHADVAVPAWMPLPPR